jgi:hypothetical protein
MRLRFSSEPVAATTNDDKKTTSEQGEWLPTS